jgi:hypothetical protein
MEKYNQAIRRLQEAELGVKMAEDLKSNAVQSLQDMVLPRLEALCKNFPDTFGERGNSFETASSGWLYKIPVASKGKSVVDGITEVDVVSFSFEYDDSYDVYYAIFDIPVPYLRDDWEIVLAKDLAARKEILDAENAKVEAEKEADERRLFERLQQKYGNKVAVALVPNVVPLFPKNVSSPAQSETETKDADLYRQILGSVAHIPT